MRQQRIERHKEEKKPQIIDERRPKLPEPPQLDPAVANQPVRTVFYMEVGDMEAAKVQLLIQQVNEMYDGAKGGIHYVVPIRHGKIGSDMEFEKEFLATVRKLCEVNDNGEIVLKDGAKDVHVIRHQV